MTRPITFMLEVLFPNGPGSATQWVLDKTPNDKLDNGYVLDGAFHDLCADNLVISVATRSGRVRQLDNFQAGTLNAVLDNSLRQFDPLNWTGPFSSAGASLVKPMRAVRFRATYAGITYELGRWFADEWGIDNGDPDDSTCTLIATDGQKVLTKINPLGIAPVGAGEDTGARIGRLLDAAGWPTLDRDIDTGNSTLQATSLAQPTWTEIILSGNSEGGDVYFGPTNRLTFKRRRARYEDTRSVTSQATFGDGAGEIPYSNLHLNTTDYLMRNYAAVACVGGTVQVAQDSASIAENLRQDFTRSDLIMQTDAEALNYAQLVVGRYAPFNPFFDLMTIELDGAEDVWPTVLGLMIGDRITVRRRPVGNVGDYVEKDCFVEGINHSLAGLSEGQWVATLQLSDAAKWSTWTLDDAKLSLLDVGNQLGTY